MWLFFISYFFNNKVADSQSNQQQPKNYSSYDCHFLYLLLYKYLLTFYQLQFIYFYDFLIKIKNPIDRFNLYNFLSSLNSHEKIILLILIVISNGIPRLDSDFFFKATFYFKKFRLLSFLFSTLVNKLSFSIFNVSTCVFEH